MRAHLQPDLAQDVRSALEGSQAGEELDFDTIASIERFAPARNTGENVSLTPAVAIVVNPTAVPAQPPDPPIEAKPGRETAPNEANFSVHEIIQELNEGCKELRIDTPRGALKVGGL